jgi:Flp pilus assembly protein TadG
MTRRRLRCDDRGASVVEFAMLSVLLVLLLFVVLQIALWCYARTVVAAATADAARYAATATGGPQAGAQRARQLIDAGLNPVVSAHIPCTAAASVDAVSGLPTRTVHCHGRLAVTFLPFELPLSLDARSSALVEGVP